MINQQKPKNNVRTLVKDKVDELSDELTKELTKKNKALERIIRVNETQIISQNERIVYLREQVEKVEKALEIARDMLSRANIEGKVARNKLVDELNKLTTKRDNLLIDVSNQQKNLDIMAARREDIQKQIADANAADKKEIKNFEKTISDLQKTKEAVEGDIQNRYKVKGEIEEEIKALNSKANDMIAYNDKLSFSHKEELDQHNSILAKLKVDIEQHRNAVTTLEKQRDNLMADVEKFNIHMANEKAGLTRREKALDRRERELSDYHRKIKSDHSVLTSL